MEKYYNSDQYVEIKEEQKEDFDTIIIDADEMISDIKREINKFTILKKDTIINDVLFKRGHVINHADINDFYQIIHRKISFLKENFNPKKIIFALSDFKNFRKKIYKDYKKSDTYSKTFLNSELRQYLYNFVLNHNDYNNNEFLNFYFFENLEADDIANIYCTKHKNEKKLLISQDKDFNTIANITLYNPKKSLMSKTTLHSSFLYFCSQLIYGDKQDNVDCLSKFQKIKADNFIKNFITKNKETNGFKLLLEIKKEYIKQNRQHMFLTNINLLKLLHHSQFFDFKNIKLLTNEDLKIFEKIKFDCNHFFDI